MTGSSEQKTGLLDDELTDIAVEFTVEMMRSASTEVIRPLDWWTRAKSALIVSAATTETYPSMVAKFLGKIQVAAPFESTSRAVGRTGKRLSELGNTAFDRFRFLCERDALYIVAMAQVKNKQGKGGQSNVN